MNIGITVIVDWLLIFAVLLMVDFVDVETPTLFRRTPGVSITDTAMHIYHGHSVGIGFSEPT